MWELDCEESWVPKNWCFWTVVMEKTLESPLNCKKIQPVYPKRDQSWVFIGRTDAEGETPILWPPYAKSWLIGRLWFWEGLRAGGEGDDRGWDGWMASPTQWTWVWVNSGSWWWTEELYKKEPHNPDNHDGVLTHLEPDILEWEVKWALGSITTNKASGGDGIPVELFQSWKMLLWKCCTQYASKFGKLSSGHRTGKGQCSFQSQRKAMPKNAQTTAQLHSSHTLVK